MYDVMPLQYFVHPCSRTNEQGRSDLDCGFNATPRPFEGGVDNIFGFDDVVESERGFARKHQSHFLSLQLPTLFMGVDDVFVCREQRGHTDFQENVVGLWPSQKGLLCKGGNRYVPLQPP